MEHACKLKCPLGENHGKSHPVSGDPGHDTSIRAPISLQSFPNGWSFLLDTPARRTARAIDRSRNLAGPPSDGAGISSARGHKTPHCQGEQTSAFLVWADVFSFLVAFRPWRKLWQRFSLYEGGFGGCLLFSCFSFTHAQTQALARYSTCTVPVSTVTNGKKLQLYETL